MHLPSTPPGNPDTVLAPRRSLLWRFALPTCAAVGLLIAGIGAYTPHAVLRAAMEEATQKSEQTANQLQTLRSFYSDHIVAKVNQPGTVKAASVYKDDPGTIPVPTTFILDYAKALENEGIQVRLVSPFPSPTRNGRVLDDFQQAAWDYLKQRPNERFTQRQNLNGKKVLRVAVADSMNQNCVSCHNSHALSPKKDWKVGDVRGLIESVAGSTRVAEQAVSKATATNALVQSLAGTAQSINDVVDLNP